jgi:hypothetical protein
MVAPIRQTLYAVITQDAIRRSAIFKMCSKLSRQRHHGTTLSMQALQDHLQRFE